MYNAVKIYTDMGLYATADLKVFLEAGWITQEEYEGLLPSANDYVAPSAAPAQSASATTQSQAPASSETAQSSAAPQSQAPQQSPSNQA